MSLYSTASFIGGISCRLIPDDPYDWNKGFKVAVFTADGTKSSRFSEDSLVANSPIQTLTTSFSDVTEWGKGGGSKPTPNNPPAPRPGPVPKPRQDAEILMYIQEVHKDLQLLRQEVKHDRLTFKEDKDLIPGSNPPLFGPQFPFRQVSSVDDPAPLESANDTEPSLPSALPTPKILSSNFLGVNIQTILLDHNPFQEFRPYPGRPDHKPPPPPPTKPVPRPKPKR